VKVLPASFYDRPTDQVAKDLIGKVLVKNAGSGGRQCRLAGVIVETEAYGHADDPASHAHRGPTRRNAVMFGRVGRAYVYFTYGNHHCVNVSARSNDAWAGAVLIRGIEPLEGIDEMSRARNIDDVRLLASGPGRLTQALGITLDHNGLDMTSPGSGLWIEEGNKREAIATVRIGITKATDHMWRFVDPSSAFVSRKVHNFS
jgi:DNA-3-methyladenine glycosylase